MAKSYEIVPNPRRGGWDVRADSGRRLASNHKSMQAAFDSAARYVRNARGGSVVVRGADGHVETFQWDGGAVTLVPAGLRSPSPIGQA
jgi:hypothetical protein